MRLGELSATELAGRLREGLGWRVGPFVVRFTTPLEFLAPHVALLYGDFPVMPDGEFPDAEVSVRRSGWMRRRVSILADGSAVYRGVPRAQVVPLVEWTLNLCAFHRPSRYLLVHAAVVEKDGQAALFPGDAGSGKSTLCAALVYRGWRLLSDEVAPVGPADGRIVPVPRPISLKGDSIEAVKRFAPQAVFGPTWPETPKGRLAHAVPPRPSVLRMDEPAEPAWVVFPCFQPGAPARLEPIRKPAALLHFATNAFNFEVLGRQGFLSLADLIDRCECFRFAYGDLDQAVAGLEGLWAAARAAGEP